MSELYHEFITQITNWQYSLNKTISSSIRTVDDGNIFFTYGLVLTIAFLYGVIHAAGPGHGKALVALYFTKEKQSYKEAFKVGYLISIIHAISAIAITFILYFIFKTMFQHNFNQYVNHTMTISATLIILIGVYFIVTSFINRNKSVNDEIKDKKSKYTIAFTIGVVPCPGVMSIVLFCVLLKKITLGILAAIVMSIGMGLTISIVGILSVLFSKKTDSFLKKKNYLLELLSGVLITVLGVFLLLGSL